MARQHRRTWGPSPLATAVQVVGGIPWAVAISGITREGLTIALQRGHLVDGRAAVRLARATKKQGQPITVEELVGMTDEAAAKVPTVAA